MTAKVVSVAGIPVEVATPGEGGGGDLPVATSSILGGVKIGEYLEAPGGVLTVPYGTPSRYGVLKSPDRWF